MKTFEWWINLADWLYELSTLIDDTKVRAYSGVQQDSKRGQIARGI
ncbi:MAG: hypothetical protein IT261_10440 [Saprospiraceae bacterium]|nr:hypothetical protein [Saprospiraceae bacterium]